MGPLLQLLTESSGLPEQIAAAVRQSNPALFNSHSSSKQCQCCKHCRTVSPAPFAAVPNPKPSACSGPVVAAACCLPTGCGLPGWPRCAGRCRQGRARQVIYGGTRVRAVGCCCWRGESGAVLAPMLPPGHVAAASEPAPTPAPAQAMKTWAYLAAEYFSCCLTPI